MNTFENLIFIPEGTILNEKLALKNALKLTLKNFGHEFGPTERLKYTQLVQQFKLLSETEQINLLLQNFLPDESSSETIFKSNLLKQSQLIKGSTDLLNQIKGHCTLILYSKEKKDELLPRLKDAKIDDLFEALFFADDFEDKLPNKNIFDQIISQLQIDPDTTLVIGSNLADEIQGAENANLKSLWIAPKKEKIPITPHPTLHLARLSDLLFYLNIE